METKLYESVHVILVLYTFLRTRQNLRCSHTKSMTVHVDEGLHLIIDLYLCSAGYISMGVNCKFGNFRENFIFANSAKRHIAMFRLRD